MIKVCRNVVVSLIVYELATFCLPANAMEPNVVDVTKLDVSSVRLHMGGQEAIDALRQKLGQSTPFEMSKVGTFGKLPVEGSIRAEWTQHDSGTPTLHPGKRMIWNISYQKGNTKIFVSFSERMDSTDPRPEAVTSVTIKVDGTMADYEQLADSALNKYGKPTWQVTDKQNMEWCGPKILEKWENSQSCDDMKVPVLEFHFNTITLSDTKYSLSSSEAIQRIAGSKPPL